MHSSQIPLFSAVKLVGNNAHLHRTSWINSWCREKRGCRALNNLAQAQPLPLAKRSIMRFLGALHKIGECRQKKAGLVLNKFTVKRRRCKKRRLGCLFFAPASWMCQSRAAEQAARIISALSPALEWKIAWLSESSVFCCFVECHAKTSDVFLCKPIS